MNRKISSQLFHMDEQELFLVALNLDLVPEGKTKFSITKDIEEIYKGRDAEVEKAIYLVKQDIATATQWAKKYKTWSYD